VTGALAYLAIRAAFPESPRAVILEEDAGSPQVSRNIVLPEAREILIGADDG
jgi:hypothetical protein